jgi:hypothetical protein
MDCVASTPRAERRLCCVEPIRLDQHAIEIQAAEQLFQLSTLTGFMGVVGLLGQGDAKRTVIGGASA